MERHPNHPKTIYRYMQTSTCIGNYMPLYAPGRQLIPRQPYGRSRVHAPPARTFPKVSAEGARLRRSSSRRRAAPFRSSRCARRRGHGRCAGGGVRGRASASLRDEFHGFKAPAARLIVEVTHAHQPLAVTREQPFGVRHSRTQP